MRPFVAMLLSAALLAGCATADEMYMPDGRVGYNISCDAGMDACLQKASDLCGARGYDIYDAGSESNPYSYVVPNGAGGYVANSGTTVQRSMLIACRKP
jgi:hypothetical protein